MSEVQFKISIPSDDEGYILLQCAYCGELFKCTADDIEDENLLDLYCPNCGLVSENYLTEDVIELAMNKVENYAMDMIYDTFKKLEEKNKSNSLMNIKVRKRHRHKSEDPIRSGIEALTENEYKCCDKIAKIKPLLKMSASYCPFCGVIKFADE